MCVLVSAPVHAVVVPVWREGSSLGAERPCGLRCRVAQHVCMCEVYFLFAASLAPKTKEAKQNKKKPESKAMAGLSALLTVASAASAPYAGLRNQGNTCYMNSLLQSLCHIPEFARAVYELPPVPPPPPPPPPEATDAADRGEAAAAPCSSPAAAPASPPAVALEMKRLLYRLGRAPALGMDAVGTERLTTSLGMGPRDVLEQQDAQEFWHTLHAALVASGELATEGQPRGRGAASEMPQNHGGTVSCWKLGVELHGSVLYGLAPLCPPCRRAGSAADAVRAGVRP